MNVNSRHFHFVPKPQESNMRIKHQAPKTIAEITQAERAAINVMRKMITHEIFCDEVTSTQSASIAGVSKITYRLPDKHVVMAKYVQWASKQPPVPKPAPPRIVQPAEWMVKLALQLVDKQRVNNAAGQRKRKLRDLRGVRSGALTILRPTGFKNEHKQVMWVCECKCGSVTVKPAAQITQHNLSSCSRRCPYKKTRGMKRRGKVSQAMRDKYPREYKFWKSMILRCTSPTHKMYPRYGGMGVTVDPEWIKSFDAFLEYNVPDLSKPEQLHAPYQKDVKLLRLTKENNYAPDEVSWCRFDSLYDKVYEVLDIEAHERMEENARKRWEAAQEEAEEVLRKELENKIRRAQL